MVNEKLSVFAHFKNSYSFATIALRKDSRIYIPFLIFALVELASLIFIYLAPREPFKAVLGPLIRTLWGEQYLHYPTNFVLLPKVAGYARMVLSVVFGSLLTGMAVAMLAKKGWGEAFKKYVSLFLIFLILTGLYYVINKAIFVYLVKYFAAGNAKFLFIGPRWWLGPFSVAISQSLALLLQAIFIYAVPILITSNTKFIGAIAGSFMFFFRNFFVTLLLVGIPLMMSVPLILLNYNSAYLMATFVPEVILGIAILGILINSMILDPLITLTTAGFYMEKKVKS